MVPDTVWEPQGYLLLLWILLLLCLVTQSCLTLCDHMDCSPPGSFVHGDSPGENIKVGCHALLQGNLPSPGIKPRSPALQADSLPSEPPGKPWLPSVPSSKTMWEWGRESACQAHGESQLLTLQPWLSLTRETLRSAPRELLAVMFTSPGEAGPASPFHTLSLMIQFCSGTSMRNVRLFHGCRSCPRPW